MPQSFGVNAMALFQKPAIGLDISDHSIEAVFIVRRSDRLVVSSYGRTTLPPGAIIDGYVERPELVRLAIRKLLADQMVPPLPKGPIRVVFALPESQVYSHIFEVPRVADDAQLGRSLAIEADGYFPYPHDEMSADFAVIGQRPDRKDIYYAAVHKDTLKRYLALFSSIGLALDAVENESASIARAALSRDETDPVMFVDIGARVTNVAVFDREGIQFSEALETAGDAFTQALAQALAISAEDADSLKRNRGLSEDLDLTAQKALRVQVDRLAKDVAAAREYYEAKSKRLIARAVLCGGSTLMPGLVEALASRLVVPGRSMHVEAVDPWVGLEIDPTLEKLGLRERGVLAATAVGLALRGAGLRKFADIDLLTAVLPSRATPSSDAGRASPKPGPLRHFGALPVWVKLAAAVGVTLAVAVGAWFAAFRLRAPAASMAPGTSATDTPATEAPGPLDLSVEAAVGATFAEAPPTMPIAIVSAETEAQVQVERPGGEQVVGRAKGAVDVINGSGNAQTLVASTRFLAQDGTLFRLDQRVVVPAGGRVTATITADQPGAQGDVPAGRFTIPGLSAAAQSVIYGVSTEAMRGGVTTMGPALTEADLAAARDRLASEARAALETALAGKVEQGRRLVEGSLRIVAIELIGAPAVGSPVGSFTAKALVRAEAWTVAATDVEVLLKARLPGDPSGYDLGAATVEAVLDSGGSPSSIRLSAKAILHG